MDDLQERYGLTYLFVAHDLSVVRHISDRVAVMYLANSWSWPTGSTCMRPPLHPYTQVLLSAVRIPDPEVEAHRQPMVLQGEVPSSWHPPAGCVFHPRCPVAIEECQQAGAPELREVTPGRRVGVSSCLTLAGRTCPGEPLQEMVVLFAQP